MEMLVVLLLIAVNGFFALSEIAFVSSRRETIEAEREHGSHRAEKVIKMMDEPDRFLSSIQVGITLIGVISGAYGGVAIADDITNLLLFTRFSKEIISDISLVVVVGSITYLTIVLGELVPKTIGLKKPERVILAVISVIAVFSTVTHPLISFLSWSTKTILRVIGFKNSGIEESDDPLKEILGIAKAAAIRNKITHEQAGIIMKTTQLRTMQLWQIMVKRGDMRCLSTDNSLSEALVLSHVHHHTRFPLVEGDSTKIIGYVNFKDIVNSLRLNPSNPSLRGICRPLISFNETDTVNAVLRKLIASHQHIALVQSNSHDITGMVTMEDILETIVGDIHDEFDMLPDHLYEISQGRYIAGGGVPLKKLHAMLDDRIPDDEKTLDLWIREHLGTNIKVETVWSFESTKFFVRKVSRSHVYEVIIETNT